MAGGQPHAHDTHSMRRPILRYRNRCFGNHSCIVHLCMRLLFKRHPYYSAYYNAYYSPLCCGILPGNACERNLFCMPSTGTCLRSNARATTSTEQANAYALAPTPAASGLPCVAFRAWGAPSFPPGLAGRGNSLRYRKQAQQKGLARYTASPALCAVRC